MNLESMYQEIILDHYRNPHPKGLRDPFDAEVHHVNPTCGDEVTLRVRMSDDGRTVRAMDVLFPGIGEIIGGSQREEDYTKLTTRMAEMHVPAEDLDWYLDTRRFGTAPHAGFGLGFERLVLFVTGMSNIRDVIPFPRYPKNAAF